QPADPGVPLQGSGDQQLEGAPAACRGQLHSGPGTTTATSAPSCGGAGGGLVSSGDSGEQHDDLIPDLLVLGQTKPTRCGVSGRGGEGGRRRRRGCTTSRMQQVVIG